MKEMLTMWEMPGYVACGECGYLLLALTPSFREVVENGYIAKYTCTNRNCGNKSHLFSLPLTRHVCLEVKDEV
jgi:hypothetical protein